MYGVSILHNAKESVNLRSQCLQNQMWGTVGSGLTSGSRPDGRTSGNPDSGSGKSGKTGKPEKSQMTYQIKALGKLVNVVTLEIWISGFRIRKNRENRENLEKRHVQSILHLTKVGVILGHH